MDDSTVSLLILAAVIALFIWNRLPVEIVAIGTGLVLYATGLLTVDQAVGGFGDPVVVFIAALFVVSEGLSSSGLTTWAGQQVIDRAGTGPSRLLVILMVMCAALTALISLNGAVAALLPVAVVLAVRAGVVPSRMLMPLAFAGSAGSLLVLTGTPINVIVSEAAVSAGERGFGFFEFGLVGVPLVLATIALTLTVGARVLPHRTPTEQPADLSGYARTLIEEYALEGDLFHLRVRTRSPYVGVAARAVDVETFPGVRLIATRAAAGPAQRLDATIAADDVLLVRGDAEAVNRLVLERVLAVGHDTPTDHLAGALIGQELGIAEVVVPPRSRLVGETVHPGMVRQADQVILAVRRLGAGRAGTTTLAVGDTMLIQGTWDALEQTARNPDVLVVDSPDLVRRQAAPLGGRAWRAVAVLVGMVVLLALGIVPAVVAALLAAGAMVLLGVVRLEQAYRAIPWTTIILVGGLIPLSIAIRTSGAADVLADALVAVVGDAGPYALMVGLFVVTAALGQVVSNMATALIIIPVAVAAAGDLGVSVRPVLMLMTIAAAASFLTPISTAANMMVMGPGAYRFGDYWRLGLPIMGAFMAVSVLLVPAIWPF